MDVNGLRERRSRESYMSHKDHNDHNNHNEDTQRCPRESRSEKTCGRTPDGTGESGPIVICSWACQARPALDSWEVEPRRGLSSPADSPFGLFYNS